jgi:5-methylcytosine-specific restriction endonuclease McrA
LNCIVCGSQIPDRNQYCGFCGARTQVPGQRRPLSEKRRFDTLKRDGFRCVYCGRSGEEAVLHIDHLIPISAGGSDELDNLVTSCEACNQGKSSALIRGVYREDSKKWMHVTHTLKKMERDLKSLREKHFDEHLDNMLNSLRGLESRLQWISANLSRKAEIGDYLGLYYWQVQWEAVDVEQLHHEMKMDISNLLAKQDREFRSLLRELKHQFRLVRDRYDWTDEEAIQVELLANEFLERIEQVDPDIAEHIYSKGICRVGSAIAIKNIDALLVTVPTQLEEIQQASERSALEKISAPRLRLIQLLRIRASSQSNV